MRLRSYAPALLGIAALAALYLYVTRDKDGVATSAAPAAHVESHTPAPAPAPAMPTTERGIAIPSEGTQGPQGQPHPVSPEEAAAHEPHPKKGAMTLDEKLAETTKHVAVMERRAALIDQQVAALEKAGKTKEAAEQRIVAERLRKHVEKLRADVAARRDPNEDASGDDSVKAQGEPTP